MGVTCAKVVRFCNPLPSWSTVWALASAILSASIPAQAQSPQASDQYVRFPTLTVSNQGSSIPLFSLKAYRAEFRFLRAEFRKIDLHGPPVNTDGWTQNISEAEWPFLSFVYLGYAAANFASCDPEAKADYLKEIRWLLDALQTPRMSGFVAPHFGPPFGADEIHVSVFVHGHFLNLALRYREVSGDAKYDSLIHRIASALVREYSSSNGPVLRSYRDMWWLTDNFPAISALNRYDEIFGRDTSSVRRLFVHDLETRYLDQKTGLFATYINPQNHSQLQGPRGISVMYGLHFLRDFDPALAAAQYRLATNCLVRTLFGMTAVREFPEGAQSQEDVDSGPLLFGLGPSASGFAIAAAAVNGDAPTAWKLLQATAVVGLPQLQDGELRYNAMPPVGQAVILFGKSQLMKSEMLLAASK